MLLSEMFNSMGMKVMSAGNGNQALMMQDEYDGDIDFLLTDVVMPEMDGVKLGEMFGAVRPDSDVIYMSGYPFMDGRRDIQVPEGAPFISKPLQEGKVRKILERALQRRSEREEA
jgi:DNA-binding NtrC family response regulator